MLYECEVVKQVKDLSYVILQTKEKKVSSNTNERLILCVLSSKFDHHSNRIRVFVFPFDFVRINSVFFCFECAFVSETLKSTIPKAKH